MAITLFIALYFDGAVIVHGWYAMISIYNCLSNALSHVFCVCICVCRDGLRWLKG